MKVEGDNDSLISQHIVSYGISKGTVVNVIAFVSCLEKEGAEWKNPWVEDCTREEFLHQFDGWEPEVRELIEVGFNFVHLFVK